MIVDVFVDESYLYLDAAIDANIHKLVKKGQSFSLTTSHDGVDVRAEGIKAVDTIKDSKGDLYKVMFPEKIYYIQRRDTFRASLAGQKKIPVALKCLDEDIDARLTDSETLMSNISVQGCLVSLSDKTGLLLDEDELSATVEFACPETSELVSVAVCLRHKRYLKRSEIWLVGFEFQNMSTEVARYLEKLVLNLQLEARKSSRFD